MKERGPRNKGHGQVLERTRASKQGTPSCICVLSMSTATQEECLVPNVRDQSVSYAHFQYFYIRNNCTNILAIGIIAHTCTLSACLRQFAPRVFSFLEKQCLKERGPRNKHHKHTCWFLPERERHTCWFLPERETHLAGFYQREREHTCWFLPERETHEGWFVPERDTCWFLPETLAGFYQRETHLSAGFYQREKTLAGFYRRA